MEKEQLVSLVTKAQQGDNEALNCLFNEFYNDLYYFALKTVKDDETALDVTQEAFVEIINTLGNLKEPAAFVTWAKQITYHQCTRYFKKKKDVLVDEDEEGNTVFDTLKEEKAEFIPDEALDKADFKKTVMGILDELSEEQRSAVMMYYFDEMSVKQIAEIQGVSEGTVKSRLNYARKAIKNSVEEYEKKHNIKLHAIPFFPFLKWIFDGMFEGPLPTASAEIIAEGVGAATGTTVTVTSATATATTVATTSTAGAVGLGAKIAAMPIVTKVIAGVVAAAIVIGGGTTAVLLSQNDNNDIPADNQSIVSSNDDTSSEIDNELVLEGIIPEGCTYTLYDGTVLTAGQKFPETCTAGDKVSYGDYLYGYECVYAKNIDSTDTWHMWKDGFDSGDSGLIESDVFGSWSIMVADQTKSSYGVIVSKINGKPIKTLYGTFFGCANMTESPKIPSTITAMPSAYWGCSSLMKAPTIPVNVERIMMSFKDCTSLKGDVIINAKLDKSLEWYYSETFNGTVNNINLTGSTPEEDLILIAKLSDNKNITVNGKSIGDSSESNIQITENCYYSGVTSHHKGSDGKYYKYSINLYLYPNGTDKCSSTPVTTPVAFLPCATEFVLVPQDTITNKEYQVYQKMIMTSGHPVLSGGASWEELFSNESNFKAMGGVVIDEVKYITCPSAEVSDIGEYYDYSMTSNGKISLTPNDTYAFNDCGYILSDVEVAADKESMNVKVFLNDGSSEEILLNLM